MEIKDLKNNSFKLIITITSVIVFILIVYIYWRYNVLYPSTDDAYIGANIANVGPQVTGDITAVYVEDHQFVKKGQPLFDIDQRSYVAAVAKAQANVQLTQEQNDAAENAVNAATADVAQRQAELVFQTKDAPRMLTLARKGVISKESGDDAIAKLDVAKAALAAAQNRLKQAQSELGQMGDANAKLQAAKAALDSAKIDLEHTRVVAPVSGILVNFDLRAGTTVFSQRPFKLFTIIENNYWWADANFKETQLERIRVGQPATVDVDIYPHHVFKGIVESISSGSGASFSLLPPENATGNWVKVTQRFPVRVHIINPDPQYPLRFGASCTVTVDTTRTIK